MKNVKVLNGKELKMVEFKVDFPIGDELDFTYGEGIPTGTKVIDGEVYIPQGSTYYFGDNPYNGGQILVDNEGGEIDIIIEDDEIDEIVTYK